MEEINNKDYSININNKNNNDNDNYEELTKKS